jgi:phospholipase/carboxylesterase
MDTPDSGLQRVDGSALRFHLSGKLERPSSMVFLLHGSGAHGGDLLPFAAKLAPMLPESLFVLPDAPQSTRDLLSPAQIVATEQERPDIDWERSRNWVRPVEAASQDETAQQQAFQDMIRPPVRGLGRLADLLLAQHALPATALAVYGFSQGGMIAMYLGIDRDPPCAGVVAHSAQFLGGIDARSRPRTLMVVGGLELEPPRAMSQLYPMAVSAARALELPFEEFVCPGLLHGFNAEVFARVATFLKQVLSEADTAMGVET